METAVLPLELKRGSKRYVSTTPSNYQLIEKFRVQQFREGRWARLGEIVSGE